MKYYAIKSFVAWPLVVLICTLACSCGFEEERSIAEQATRSFRRLVASGEYDSIYDGADPAYKEKVGQALSRRLFSSIAEKMGPCSSSKITRSIVNFGRPWSMVVLRFDTTCANGILDETFSWKVIDQTAYLVGYEANSPVLVLD
jgi:hypothetical protein